MGLDFPGNGSGADTEASLSLPSTGSISFWIRVHAFDGPRVLATNDNFEGRFDGSTLDCDWGKSGGNTMDVGALSLNTLHHIVSTWNTTSGAGSCYKDAVAGDTSTDRNSVTNDVMMFGDRSGTSDPLNGEIYDVRIYDRVLTAAEVQTLYSAGGGDGIVYGLVYRWTMDEDGEGDSFSVNGLIRDHGPNKVDLDVGSGTNPDFIYDAPIVSRRRAA